MLTLDTEWQDMTKHRMKIQGEGKKHDYKSDCTAEPVARAVHSAQSNTKCPNLVSYMPNMKSFQLHPQSTISSLVYSDDYWPGRLVNTPMLA